MKSKKDYAILFLSFVLSTTIVYLVGTVLFTNFDMSESEGGSYDIIVVGAGPGGIGASIQAAKMGSKVLLIEGTDCIGGQITCAGVGTLDSGYVMRDFPSGIYKDFLGRVQLHYERIGKSPSTCYWRDYETCVEPEVGIKILEEMLAEYDSNITIAKETKVVELIPGEKACPESTETSEECPFVVAGVITAEGFEYRAAITIDATENGDLITIADAPYRVANLEVKGGQLMTAEQVTELASQPGVCLQDINFTSVIKKYSRSVADPNTPGSGVPEHLRFPEPPPGYNQDLIDKFKLLVDSGAFGFKHTLNEPTLIRISNKTTPETSISFQARSETNTAIEFHADADSKLNGNESETITLNLTPEYQKFTFKYNEIFSNYKDRKNTFLIFSPTTSNAKIQIDDLRAYGKEPEKETPLNLNRAAFYKYDKKSTPIETPELIGGLGEDSAPPKTYVVRTQSTNRHIAYRGLPDSESALPDYKASPRYFYDDITKTVLNGHYDEVYTPESVIYSEIRDEKRTETYCNAKLETMQFLYYFQTELGQADWSVQESSPSAKSAYLATNLCDNIPSEFKEIEMRMSISPYVREAARVIGQDTLTGQEMSKAGSGNYAKSFAPMYNSLSVGDYTTDLHQNTQECWKTKPELYETIEGVTENYNLHKAGGGAFQIPSGVFIPKYIQGLLPAEKNYSYTRISLGASRLQGITMTNGQITGVIAHKLASGTDVKDLDFREIQDYLVRKEGIRISKYTTSLLREAKPNLWADLQIGETYGVILPSNYNPEEAKKGNFISYPVNINQDVDKELFILTLARINAVFGLSDATDSNLEYKDIDMLSPEAEAITRLTQRQKEMLLCSKVQACLSEEVDQKKIIEIFTDSYGISPREYSNNIDALRLSNMTDYELLLHLSAYTIVNYMQPPQEFGNPYYHFFDYHEIIYEGSEDRNSISNIETFGSTIRIAPGYLTLYEYIKFPTIDSKITFLVRAKNKKDLPQFIIASSKDSQQSIDIEKYILENSEKKGGWIKVAVPLNELEVDKIRYIGFDTRNSSHSVYIADISR